MTFLIIMLMIITTITGGWEAYNRWQYGISFKKVLSLSKPSKRLLGEYNDLPKDSRPVSNIYPILTAMDINFPNAEAHFRQRYSYDNEFSWNCGCYRECSVGEWKSMHDHVDGIKVGLAEREHQFKLSRVSHRMDAAKDLTAQLRDERNLITDVTRELT